MEFFCYNCADDTSHIITEENSQIKDFAKCSKCGHINRATYYLIERGVINNLSRTIQELRKIHNIPIESHIDIVIEETTISDLTSILLIFFPLIKRKCRIKNNYAKFSEESWLISSHVIEDALNRKYNFKIGIREVLNDIK